MIANVCWLLPLLLLSLAWVAWAAWCCQPSCLRAGVIPTPVHRRLKPRSPDDCPACRQHALQPRSRPQPSSPVVPWRERKSPRGAPKRVNTQGFACPTPTCTYYRITDAQVHALVGDGTHGRHEPIQTFRCQACRTTFSAHRNTPLYRLKTPAQQVAQVLSALAEGLDIAAAERIFGYRHTTITTWLTRAGEHSTTLHDCFLQNLHLPHLQFDELRTRLRSRACTLWLWLAIDPISKIIPVLQLGARTQNAAHTVVHDLRRRLASGCLPVFTSDGLNLYFYALTAHFGDWVEGKGRGTRRWQVVGGLIYGQVKKRYQRRRLACITPVMQYGTHQQVRAALQALGLSGRLNTAFVERVNLTVRQSVAALARRTWSTALDAPQLLAHLQWWRGYYHFVRPHASLRIALAQPCARGGRRQPRRYRHRTPAMAAGLTRHRWAARDLLALPLPPEPIDAV